MKEVKISTLTRVWKKTPLEHFIGRKEKSMTGFKASKDRLTLLLEANASWGHEFEASLHLSIPKILWP